MPRALKFFLVLVSISFSGSAKAAVVTFPDEMTPNLVYSSIEETNGSILPGFTYYGGVGTSGEALTFEAINFRVESYGGVKAVDARISFTVTAKPGQLIDSITVTEGGRAAASGEGSFVDVNSGGFVLIDGILSGSESDSYSLAAPAAGTEFWSLSYTFNFKPTDEVSISLDNALFAFAIPEPNGNAYIDKTGVIINVSIVPEPSSALALLAVSGVGVCVRRRRR